MFTKLEGILELKEHSIAFLSVFFLLETNTVIISRFSNLKYMFLVI